MSLRPLPSGSSSIRGTTPRRAFARRLAFGLIMLASATAILRAYTWNNVTIGGGGYTTGLIVHPKNDALVYGRTDSGGVNRWDSVAGKWIPLMDEFTSSNTYSVEAMNVDPADTTKQKVYIVVGKQGGTAAYRSASQGAPGTWVDTGLPTSVFVFGNGDRRWAGERLAIDPNKPGRAFLGTRQDGLWLNTNIDTSTVGSSTWSQIPTSQVPIGSGVGVNRGGSTSVGINFVAFDTSGGTNGSGFTKNIYVGVYGDGVYKTTDAGTTWSHLSGSPSFPIQGNAASTGMLFVTHDTGVSRLLSGVWTNVTPSGQSGNKFAGLDISTLDTNRVVVALYNTGGGLSQIFLATDASTGCTWSGSKLGTQTFTVPWFNPSVMFAAGTAGLKFANNSGNPYRVWFSDLYGNWKTDDISAATPVWSQKELGHEEVFANAICATPPVGTNTSPVYTGNLDVSGFRHANLTAFPALADRLDPFPPIAASKEVNTIDVSESNNNIVYRAANDGSASAGNGWRSADGGATWTSFDPASDPVLPDDSVGGRVSVSATDPNRIIWVPFDHQPYLSVDGGVNWTASTLGSPALPNIITSANLSNVSLPLASDKVVNCFYAYKPGSGLWKSNGASAGAAFTQVSSTGLPTASSGFYAVKTVPTQSGGVWIQVTGGIYKSTNSGTTFTQLTNVQSAKSLGFGIKSAGSSYPATAYFYGQVTGDTEDWLYRSDDMGATWTKLNDATHRFGKVQIIEGDRQVYGRVYLGTSGRGFFYGVP